MAMRFFRTRVPILVLLLTCIFAGAAPVQPPTAPQPGAPRAIRLTGFTLDSVNRLAPIIEALKSLPSRPAVRIVFDENVPAADYMKAIDAIHPHALIMGELLDSSAMKKCDIASFQKRAEEYFHALPLVDVWEVANEINGDPNPKHNWVGNDAWAKASIALAMAKHLGKKTAVTFYLQPDQAMFKWIDRNVTKEQREMIDWALVSYYEKDNGDWSPDWQSIIDQLGNEFPTAMLGIGECGDDRSQEKAIASFERYYRKLTVNHPRYLFGGFYWYTKQFIGKNAFLLPELEKVMRNE